MYPEEGRLVSIGEIGIYCVIFRDINGAIYGISRWNYNGVLNGLYRDIYIGICVSFGISKGYYIGLSNGLY